MSGYDSKDILSVLEYIRHTYGLDAFSRRGKLVALISDLAPSLVKERKLIERMDKLGLIEEYVRENDSSDPSKKRLIGKSIEMLTKSEFIQHSVAVEYSVVLAKALGWSSKAVSGFGSTPNIWVESNLSSSNHSTTKEKDTNVNSTGIVRPSSKAKWALLLLIPCIAFIVLKLYPIVTSSYSSKESVNSMSGAISEMNAEPTQASSNEPQIETTNTHTSSNPIVEPNKTIEPIITAIPLAFDAEQFKCRAVDIGHEHVIAVQSNGKVVAAGSNAYGQCNVSSWNNIVEVAAGFTFSLGLRSDGTIVSAGEDYDNEYGSLKVDWSRISSWRNIEHISAYGHGIIALDKTGKVHIEGGPHDEEGKYELPSWVNNKRAVEVSAGCNHMMVLYEDGTVGAFGVNKRPENVGAYTYTKGSCDLGEWHDIVAIAAAGDGSVGLMADGTVVYEGVNTKSQHSTYTSLRNVAAISSKGWHLLYITFDGQVGAVGWADDDRCNVNAWNSVPGKKLVAVAASAWNNVFVFNDGSAVMTGQSYILRNTADKVKQWKNIVPKR